MKRVCICGGGALAHVCAGVLSSQEGVTVNVLTRKPESWSHEIYVTDMRGKTYGGVLNVVSNDASFAVQNCDIVLLCLPGYAIESVLNAIKPFVSNKIVGSIVSSTGFFFAAHRILGEKSRLFGFQRVPYIARIVEYGHSANLLGYKHQLAVAIENVEDKEDLRQLIETLWMTPTRILDSFYEVALTNSNAILHTGRLYSMWKDWNGEVSNHNSLFYTEWTNEASQIVLDMDFEFMQLLDVLPITKGAIPSLLEYYECHDAESLTKKLRSIPAFQNIYFPMKEIDGGWVPDFESRYFTEDFPYGLRFIVEFAIKKNMECPTLNKVYKWYYRSLTKSN